MFPFSKFPGVDVILGPEMRSTGECMGADLNFSQHVEGLAEKQRSLGETLMEIIPTNIFESLSSSSMLSIIFFAILFGFFVTRVKNPHREVLKKAFNAIFQVTMQITLFVIKFTPLGIFGIVAKVVADGSPRLQISSYPPFASPSAFRSVIEAALETHKLQFPGSTSVLPRIRTWTTHLINQNCNLTNRAAIRLWNESGSTV